MFKQLRQHANAFFQYQLGVGKKAFRGFTLIEVAFMVMIVSIIILPVVGAVNANNHNGEPTITETIERQQSIEQGMRSLMQRAINGKIIITDIENPTTQFKTIDANTTGASGDLYDLSDIYKTDNTQRRASQGFFRFKVPIGVQNVNTKDLFKFRWTIKDASFENTIDSATGNPVTKSTTPDGLKKVGLLLEAFDAKASDTDINGGTVNPLATQYATTFYSETPVGTPTPNTNTDGVIINLDLNRSGCLERWLQEGSRYGIASPKLWYYNPYGHLQIDDCGENTSNEPTEGLRDWYDTEFDQRTTNPALAYLQRLDIGMQIMDDIDPTDTSLMDVSLTANPSTFLSDLPSRASSGMMHYDDFYNLPEASFAYSTTARAIQALKDGNYTKGTIIHIINTNLDDGNQKQNKGNLNGIPLSTKQGVFTQSDTSLLSETTTAPISPLPSINSVVTAITDPSTFITTTTTTLYNNDETVIRTEITHTDDLLNLAIDNKSTLNANDKPLTIKHYVILHKGIDANTGEYFTAIANQTGGKVYYVTDDRSKLATQLRAIFRDVGEIKKTRKSKTYRHSMR